MMALGDSADAEPAAKCVFMIALGDFSDAEPAATCVFMIALGDSADAEPAAKCRVSGFRAVDAGGGVPFKLA
jgi:hypothetical protein